MGLAAARPLVLSALLGALIVVVPGSASADPIVVSSTGTAAQIAASVATFRTDLGDLNPNTVGSAGGGRREINWDGVPATQTDPNAFSADFFNTISPRGAVLSAPGSSDLLVSRNAPDPLRFSNRNAAYSAGFGSFSAQKIFSPLGGNVTQIDFRVPGTTVAATTSAFGVVLTDVDLNGVSSVELFDVQGTSLGRTSVPAAQGDGKLSFVGVELPPGQRAARARITAGNVPLGVADTVAGDAVAIDDLIYGEPQPVGSVSAASPAPVSEQAGSATVTLSRSTGFGDGSVAYATIGGSASPGSDFVATSGRAHFADGATTTTVQVPIVVSVDAEPVETFDLALSSPQGSITIGSPALATITIQDVAIAPSVVVVAPPVATTSPGVQMTLAPVRVSALVTTRGKVPRNRLRRGVPIVVGSSQDGQLVVRLSAGRRTLVTLASRPINAGATALRIRVGRKALEKLPASARSVVLAVTVTDAARNVGRATRKIKLRR